MLPKRWMTLTASFLLVFLLVAGYITVMAQYGSQNDPIVTVSYINDVLSKEIAAKTDEIIKTKTNEYTAGLDAQLKDMAKSIDDKVAMLNNDFSSVLSDQTFINKVAEAINAAGGTAVASGAASNADFKVVKIAKGKTLTANVGAEFLLRFGSAKCVASGSPGLINISSGGILENGGAMLANNLYLVTVDGRGFTATAEATVLVRGVYTIK